MSFCRILEKDWVNWRKVSQGKLACIVLYCIDQLSPLIGRIWHFEVARETGSSWLAKCIVGLFWGTHFQHAANLSFKTVPQRTWQPSRPALPAQPQSGEFELFPPVHTKGNTAACLTGHALFSVWHHRIRKPPFSSVHTKAMDRRFQKSPHWRAFRNVRFRWPSSLLHWIRADRWPNRRKNKTHTCGRGLKLLLYDFTATGAKTSHKNCIRTASNFFALIPSPSFCPGNVGLFCGFEFWL